MEEFVRQKEQTEELIQSFKEPLKEPMTGQNKPHLFVLDSLTLMEWSDKTKQKKGDVLIKIATILPAVWDFTTKICKNGTSFGFNGHKNPKPEQDDQILPLINSQIFLF